MADLQRLPHATLDIESRRPKAAKIYRLLGMNANRPLRVLEVGCGSGVISHLIAKWLGPESEVHAVDVVDQRVVSDNFHFRKIEDVSLPYADGMFDYVISNHVIEHVGDRQSQSRHIGELRRALSSTGTGYLAVPSRWQLVEPHYRLPFLSWLPRKLRTPYLRLARRGSFYDCEPLTMPEVESLLAAQGLSFENQCEAAIHSLADTEAGRNIPLKLATRLPRPMLHALRSISPTHIYLFYKSSQQGRNV